MRKPLKRVGLEVVEREYYVDPDAKESSFGKLTHTQRARLGDLVDDDPELVARTEDLILYIVCPKTIPDSQRTKFVADADRVYKAFSKCGASFLNWVDEGSMVDGDSPTQTVIDMARAALVAPRDSASLKAEICVRARQVFDDLELFDTLGIEVGTSSTGNFTNYLRFISEASGYKFDAPSLARRALKPR